MILCRHNEKKIHLHVSKDINVSKVNITLVILLSVHINCRLLHSGPGHPYKVAKNLSTWKKLIGVPNTTSQSRATANAKRLGKDLQQWIDNLIVRFVYCD